MREIKFRAWLNESSWSDEPEVHMLNFEELRSRYEGEMGDMFGDEDVTLMQFTGLKDKNGVEIYEGDIVTSDYGAGDVYYDNNACFNVRNYYDQSADYPTIAFSEGVFEVIGNIYENPELLESAA